MEPSETRGLPKGRRALALAVGLLEAVVLVAYAVSIVVFALVGTTSGVSGATDIAVPVLAGLLGLFGVFVALLARGVWQGKSAARTPFVLAQAFVIIAGWTVASGGQAWERAIGAVVTVVAVAAAWAALTSEPQN